MKILPKDQFTEQIFEAAEMGIMVEMLKDHSVWNLKHFWKHFYEWIEKSTWGGETGTNELELRIM